MRSKIGFAFLLMMMPGLGQLTTINFTPDTSTVILNPERGFAQDMGLGNNLSTQRSSNRTVVRGMVYLTSYTSSALPQAFLDSVSSWLTQVRTNHLKIGLRFSYDSNGVAPCVDADSLQRILDHITQLGPVLTANQDVILGLEVGWTGCWGEGWGGSGNFTTAQKGQITTALLNAVPGTFAILRTPEVKTTLYGYTYANPMTEAESYTGTHKSRTLHYNDCILSTADQQDQTYQSPVDSWAAFVKAESRWGPMEGESCGIQSGTRGHCTQAGGQAQTVLADYHFSWLGAYAGNVPTWQSEGCYDDIGLHLGHRFALNSVSHTTTISPSGTLHLDVSLTNQGYAALFTARTVYAVLDGPGGRFNLPMPVDPRRWPSGANSFSVDLSVPAGVPVGTYTLALWLPDAAEGLQSDPLYAIQFANTPTIWNAANGYNVITNSLNVSAESPSSGSTISGKVTISGSATLR